MLYSIVAGYLALGSSLHAVAADPYTITGIKTQSNNIPIRRNINDLASEAGPQWDLYIQALASMQKVDSADPLSFFQVGGIHGEPAYEWNNTGQRLNDDDGWSGYCPHGEGIFMSWHRPYLLLHEQVLVKHARKIAAEYTGSKRKRYIKAAALLRTPFWDWADIPHVPNSTVPGTMTINTPRGRKEVRNPLARYSFPQDALDGNFGTFQPDPNKKITRCPPPQNYPETANQNLEAINLRESVYHAFVFSKTFEDFGTTMGSGTSVEQAHNHVHNSAACGEQLLDLAYSAFDPLFMLHHANIDRLWALWQAAHPDMPGLSISYPGGERFTTPAGTTIGPNSPLAPFYRKGWHQHTSNSVLSTHKYGYTYEGAEKKTQHLDQKRQYRDGDDQSESTMSDTLTGYSEKHKRRAVAFINKLYSSRDHDKERIVYQAHIRYRVEDLERPARVKVYFCNSYVGYFVALKHPKRGPSAATIHLNRALEACARAGIKPSQYRNEISASIHTHSGKDIPISRVRSMKLELERFDEIPAKSKGEFPTILNRRVTPGKLKEYQPRKQSQAAHHIDYKE
ncbi:tyrosinase [Hirsutella rhossiliensis]|uniref:Tyrosinase n=1 Tax=Hirsutella rhossiliensis TaxID=111463 RepID=A0A9P8SK06_9HYPO|nr:tyrosinase [Hirsutella rhossiliensis]KAH0964265.1 tyrosinase [Hirsutella rhossiliensis]